MKRVIIFTLCLISSLGLLAQVSMNANGNDPDPSAMLDVQSADKGFLMPRMDSTSRKAIVNPAQGLMVYDSTSQSFWYYDTGWQEVGGEGDNLGDHRALTNLKLNGHWLSQDGDNEGIFVDSLGKTGVGTSSPKEQLEVKGAIKIGNTDSVNSGTIRWNPQTQDFEGYEGITWKSLTQGDFKEGKLFGFQTAPTTTINQSVYNTSQSPTSVWQSFTTVSGGPLVGLGFAIGSGLSVKLKIYEGEGISGNLLYTQDIITKVSGLYYNPLASYALTQQIPIITGNKYTIQIIRNGPGTLPIGASNSNSYSGGRLSLNPNYDLVFKVFQNEKLPFIELAPDTLSFMNGSMNVLSNGKVDIGTTSPGSSLHLVGQLTYEDGNQAIGHILTSDANGVASWQSPQTDNLGNHIATQPLNMASQDITNSDTVWANSFIGDGSGLINTPTDDLGNHTATQALNMASQDIANADTVWANAFIGDGSGLINTPGDHLGDHSATQNIALNTNYLSGDGDNEGIYIKPNGNVGIGTNSPITTLQVNGNTYLTGKVGIGANNPLVKFQVNGTSYLNGNVGIGILNPPSKLGVSGGIAIGSGYAGSTVAPANGAIIEGNVGIGTNTPTKAKVEISGTVSSSIGAYSFLRNNSNPVVSITGKNTSGAIADFSLWASGRIAALQFNAFSDARIKHIQGISDRTADLSTLMQIEITDYTMRDTIAKGGKLIKKVIAQQVAKVYPQAVTTNLTEVIPDIYERAEIQNGWIMLTTNLQPGQRVKLITEEKSEVYELTAVETDRFQVKGLSLHSGQVFVYGREVDDFHTVDYEALSMLNVSATQEQQRRIEVLELENVRLKEQVQQLQSLEARLGVLEAALSAQLPARQRIESR